jgi:arylsulfatase A-like enzyme
MATTPNIILIFCDDLGYGDLGCYGSAVNPTPRLDRMAAEGLRLTDFYVSAPLCSPSRASLLTGCYSQRVGLGTGETFGVLMPRDRIGLAPEEMTIADLLREAGYATCCLGKWHLGDQAPFLPDRHGFDEFFGLPYSNDMHPAHPKNEFHNFPPLPLLEGSEVVELEPDQARLETRYTERALRFIREHREGPFFLYFPHMYVHLPLYPPADFAGATDNGAYGDEVAYLDHSTGQILDLLAELGIEEETLVIFTSDNGANARNGSSNAPLRGQKGSTFEGGMREPCLLRWPGTIPPGSVSGELVTAMDLLPTLAGLAGVAPPADRIIDGRDVGGLLTAPARFRTPHEAFFYYRGVRLEAVRSGDWKLHLQREELYNLREDIGEAQNRFAEEPERVAELQRLAEACREDLGDGELMDWSRRQPPTVTRPGRGVRPVGRVAAARGLS